MRMQRDDLSIWSPCGQARRSLQGCPSSLLTFDFMFSHHRLLSAGTSFELACLPNATS